MRTLIAAIRRFTARVRDAHQHPSRPPVLGVRYTNQYTRSGRHVCDDVAMAAAIALVQCAPAVEIVTIPMRFWHLPSYRIPDAAWRTWKVIPTGEFLAAVRRAGVPIGTYHSSGEAALVAIGYDHDIAHRMVAQFAVAQ